ncbi:hypothetical protein AAG570_005849 [Ranatra chinensis]|uniref:Uncharacterized protein n=1 Tax=Ranatra chinensis TaxID=642074 RepID=A0ABD0YI37_9HEMI
MIGARAWYRSVDFFLLTPEAEHSRCTITVDVRPAYNLLITAGSSTDTVSILPSERLVETHPEFLIHIRGMTVQVIPSPSITLAVIAENSVDPSPFPLHTIMVAEVKFESVTSSGASDGIHKMNVMMLYALNILKFDMDLPKLPKCIERALVYAAAPTSALNPLCLEHAEVSDGSLQLHIGAAPSEA